ncbi:MAG: aminotransferase class I/II-fold pyridoxal phosphate-dependent enzyme [Treponema sp.]|nr:aminotransferase class I/II-fold pyridoxal phosphate-dependent enzyme [Treponema sp.]MDY5839045.1 aminotransferase class I/II-fold pyridoxal phosphate-dependent enzyme [Treponema sp.]
MIYFESDYTEGAHPKILERLNETNMIQASGYGHDEFCESAKNKIRKTINCPNAQIQFITGGTQTNQIVIDTMLKPFEGVVSAQTGHVNSHEAGAIEYTGHKVIPIPQHEGKIDGTELNDYLETFFSDGNNEHMVFPGMVYISHPTEYGTLYTKNELTKISSVCRKNNIPLFMDGARLGYGIMAKSTDLSLEDIAELCDVFYIGGTKCGALCGEAVVFTKNNMPQHFENLVKKHGALLAKGRLLGVQFDALFTDNLYLEISKNAIDTAETLKKALIEKGYRFLLNSPTNQQFVILENKFMEELKKSVKFNFWEKFDKDHTVVRFATSWSTKMENVEKLINLL